MIDTMHEFDEKYTYADDLSTIDRDRLLESDRRRMTIDVLVGKAGPVELADLAAGIAARENGLDAVDRETVARVAISLHHVHLPRIADCGVIEYDPSTNRIEACPRRRDFQNE